MEISSAHDTMIAFCALFLGEMALFAIHNLSILLMVKKSGQPVTVYHIIYQVSYMSGGSLGFLNHQGYLSGSKYAERMKFSGNSHQIFVLLHPGRLTWTYKSPIFRMETLIRTKPPWFMFQLLIFRGVLWRTSNKITGNWRNSMSFRTSAMQASARLLLPRLASEEAKLKALSWVHCWLVYFVMRIFIIAIVNLPPL